jgi:hypothetical protein
MAAGSYTKLRTWCNDHGRVLKVEKLVSDKAWWTLSMSIADPVVFSASAQDTSLDAAAEKVLADLVALGVVVE